MKTTTVKYQVEIEFDSDDDYLWIERMDLAIDRGNFKNLMKDALVKHVLGEAKSPPGVFNPWDGINNMFSLIKFNESKGYIYALVDPISGRTKYVGRTKDVNARYRSHISVDGDTLKDAWVRTLRRNNLYPLIMILQVLHDVDTDEGLEAYRNAEKSWIEAFSKVSVLTNVDHNLRLDESYTWLDEAGYSLPNGKTCLMSGFNHA